MADLEEQKRYQELQRADQAKALLTNPMMVTALEDIEKQVLAQMEGTHDTEMILKLHRMLVCGRKFKNILQSHIETGKMAAIELEQKRKFNLLKWGTN
jgi:hypothetical protein